MPYVHLASPAAQHDSASSAACWSTQIPATGSAGGPSRLVSPIAPALSQISGSASSLEAERGGCLLAPRHRLQVEQERARRGSRVRHEPFAAEAAEEPDVRGGDGDVGIVGLGAHLLAQPDQLGRGEVGVQLEPRDGGEALGPPARGEAFADGGRPAVRPHDAGGPGSSGRALPGQDGLALVGQPDRVDASGAGERRPRRPQHAAPEVVGVDLRGAIGPAAHRHGHLHLGLDRPVVVHHEGLRRRCPLVDGEDTHVRVSPPGSRPAPAAPPARRSSRGSPARRRWRPPSPSRPQ